MSRSNQLIISPNFNYKKIFLFGFYGLSYGKDNNEGEAANPYNVRAEWGPSTFADVRHRFILGTNIPLPLKVSLSPFIMANSGTPYNIVIGQDLNGDSFATERPELLSLPASQCTGTSLVYESGFGCFNLNPAAGAKTIERNSGTGTRDLLPEYAPLAHLVLWRQRRVGSCAARSASRDGRRSWRTRRSSSRRWWTRRWRSPSWYVRRGQRQEI